MVELSKYIKENQLISYFILAFAISWAIMIAIPGYASLIAVFGPALGAIIIAFISYPGKTGISSKKRWGLFAVLFVIIFPLGFLTDITGVVVITNFYLKVLYYTVFAFLAAFVLSRVFASNKGVYYLVKQLTTWRVNFGWYIFAIFLPPLVFILSDVITALMGQGSFNPNLGGIGLASIGGVILTYFVTLLFSGPLGEEIGWRGLVTPLLQKKYTPLVSSLILGIIWVLWHAPWHFTGFYGTYPDGLYSLLLRFVSMIPMTLIYTLIYNNTKGSLLFVLLYHTSEDASFIIIGLGGGFGITYSFYVFSILWVIVGIIAVIAGRMWKELPEEKKEILTNLKKRATTT